MDVEIFTDECRPVDDPHKALGGFQGFQRGRSLGCAGKSQKKRFFKGGMEPAETASAA